VAVENNVPYQPFNPFGQICGFAAIPSGRCPSLSWLTPIMPRANRPSMLTACHHLVTRIRSNGKADLPLTKKHKKCRGCPPTYGAKVKLNWLFSKKKHFQCAPSPIYGETNVEIRFAFRQLLWKSLGEKVVFV